MKLDTYFHSKYIVIAKYLIAIYLICSANSFNAQTITAGGSNWTVIAPSITEAGSNYAGTYESATNLIILSGFLPGAFLNLLSGGSAKVSMKYNITSWNNSLHLYAKRSGGTASIGGICIACSATINGGTTYVEIPPAVDTTFFTINFAGVLGLGNSVTYSGINTQLQISGVSVTIPAAAYSAQIIFTIGPN